MQRWKFWSAGAFAVSIAIAAIGSSAFAKPDVANLKRQPIAVSASVIQEFLPGERNRDVFGRLRYLGGLSLSSSDVFGGFSGLVIGADGRRMTAVSDAGFWLTATITYAKGRIAGLDGASVGPILGKNGLPIEKDEDRDVEAITLLSGTVDQGIAALMFEINDRLTVYPLSAEGLEGPLRSLKLPSYVTRLKANRGLESVAVIAAGKRKGTRLAFSEGRLDSRGHIRGWLMTDAGSEELFLRQIDGFDITDLAALPDGGMIVLERRFRWTEGVKMRLRRLRPADLRPGAIIDGDILFEADGTYNIDNMEGLAVHRDAAGTTILTLISDDNFRFFQRTLLLQFALIEP